MTNVEIARKVWAAKSYNAVDGVELDTFSASAIVAVADALSSESLAKLEAMPLRTAANICLKLCAK